MDGESQQSDTTEPEDQRPAPVLVADLGIQAVTVMNQVAEPRRGQQHKQAHAGPCEKHDDIDSDDAEYAAHEFPLPLRAPGMASIRVACLLHHAQVAA